MGRRLALQAPSPAPTDRDHRSADDRSRTCAARIIG